VTGASAAHSSEGLSKVLIIGSGPIIIGQAAEFDYSGTQACRAIREAGLEVVLVNSNPATIMTDAEVADRVYIEPLIPEVLTEIIARELIMLGSRGSAAPVGVAGAKAASESSGKAPESLDAFPEALDEEDDDLPF